MKLASQFRKLAVAPPESQKEAAAFSFGFDVDSAASVAATGPVAKSTVSKGKQIPGPAISPSSPMPSRSLISPDIVDSMNRPEGNSAAAGKNKASKKADKKSPSKKENQISGTTTSAATIESKSSPSVVPQSPSKALEQLVPDGGTANDRSDSDEEMDVNKIATDGSGVSVISSGTATSNKKKKKKNKKKSAAAAVTAGPKVDGGALSQSIGADNNPAPALSREEIAQVM
jgi:hypothetical protein